MTKEENTDKSMPCKNLEELQTLPAGQNPPKICNPEPTKGEKRFDWLVYGGVSGLGQYIANLGLTYAFIHGKGKPLLDKIVKGVSKNGGVRTAEQVALTTALSMGGNLSIVPIKLLEDRKEGIVKHLNETLDPTRVDEPLKDHKKQTWKSLIGGRVGAWLSVFAGFKALEHTAGPEKLVQFEEAFAKNVVCEPLGFKLANTHVGGKETLAYKLGRIGALDLFATVTATVLLYVGSKMLAPKRKDVEPEAPTPSPVVLAADVERIVKDDTPARQFTKEIIPARSHTASVQATEPLLHHSL